MKYLGLILILSLSVNSHAFKLSKRAEKRILKNLTKACGKVWCTGNYKIDFESLKCKTLPGVDTKCILKAEFKYNNVKNFITEGSYLRLAGVQKSYPGICYFIVTNENELSLSRDQLSKQFYKDVDTCVTNIEKFIEK